MSSLGTSATSAKKMACSQTFTVQNCEVHCNGDEGDCHIHQSQERTGQGNQTPSPQAQFRCHPHNLRETGKQQCKNPQTVLSLGASRATGPRRVSGSQGQRQVEPKAVH